MSSAPSRGPGAPFAGTWRIIKMSVWGQDAVDLCGPGYFEFTKDGFGSVRFIAVEGDLDCRFGKTRAGKPIVRFSWSGFDENDPASGRGWAILTDDKLIGRIFFHRRDDSSFTAKREAIERRPPRPRRGRGR